MCSLKRDITSTIIHDAVHGKNTFPGITLTDMSFKEKQNNNNEKKKKKKRKHFYVRDEISLGRSLFR